MPRITLIPSEVRGRLIKGQAEKAGLLIPELAKRTGIPRATMYDLLQHPDNIRATQLGLIQKRIRMPLDDFLKMHQLKLSDFPGKVVIMIDGDTQD